MDSGVFGYGYTCVIDLYKYIHYRAGGSLYALFLIVKDFLPKKKCGAKCYIYTFLSDLYVHSENAPHSSYSAQVPLTSYLFPCLPFDYIDL